MSIEFCGLAVGEGEWLWYDVFFRMLSFGEKKIRRSSVLLNGCKRKVELVYPCPWVYKIIGREEGELRAAIADIIQARECLISLSNFSSGGKYLCLDVELVVVSAEDRAAQYLAFKGHAAVVLVL